MRLRLTSTREGCGLAVRVHPGAKCDAICGTHDGALKVGLRAPATDGRANQALVALLAERMGLARAQVTLVAGAASRSKVLRVGGLTPDEVEQRLLLDLA